MNVKTMAGGMLYLRWLDDGQFPARDIGVNILTLRHIRSPF